MALVLVIAGTSGVLLILTFGFRPVLKNLLVDFGDWDPATNRSGAFLFLQSEDKVFLEFGAEVSGPEGPKILPTFEYRVLANSNVYAPCDGFIVRSDFQADTNDYEIFIAPNGLSWVKISIDHISNLTKSLGQYVMAGEIIGKPGTWYGELGRVELSINENPNIHRAPFALFDPELQAEYEALVTEHMKDWEDFKGNSSIYDQENMVYPGCNYASLVGI